MFDKATTTALLLAYLLCGGTPLAYAGKAAASSDALTAEASQLYRAGKLQPAVEHATKAIALQPKNWYAQSTLSYLVWQQGNVVDAMAAGKEAVKLSPRNELALLNLAHMEQTLSDFPSAIADYQRAVAAAPDDWAPWLWLARCYMRNGKDAEAHATLQRMAARQGNSFDWYYQLGQGFLDLDEPRPVLDTAKQAARLAQTQEQRNRSSVQLFDAMLRDHRLNDAQRLSSTIFGKHYPVNGELYVKAASDLLSASDPDAGKQLLQDATDNLHSSEDSEAWFELGQVFRTKAGAVSTDQSKYSQWLACASDADEKALALEPYDTRFYMALAGVRDLQGKPAEANEALNHVAGLDKVDLLAPYMVAHPSLNLSVIEFKIEHLTCGCQLTRVDLALCKTPGVAFVSLRRQKPYEGTILVDESLRPASAVFDEAARSAFESYPKTKQPPPTVKFEQVATRKVTRVSDGTDEALAAKSRELPPPPRRLPPAAPVMPISSQIIRAATGLEGDATKGSSRVLSARSHHAVQVGSSARSGLTR